jgi:hypothetical protein
MTHIDEELQQHLEQIRLEHEERTFFLKHHLGAEVHWFFSQGAEALKQGLILPACSSFIIGIESSLRVTMAQIEEPVPVEELDPTRILSNRLLVAARAAGLPVEKLAFAEEPDFIDKLESVKPNQQNVEIVRVRHNLCHGNILEYINKDLGEYNYFFTPECCLKLAIQLLQVSKAWVEELGKFRKAMQNA